MFNKIISTCLIFSFLLFTVLPSTYSQSKNDRKRAEKEAKVKKGIRRLGVGEEAKLTVRLYDNTKVKGYVKEVNDETFTMVEKKTGNEKTINYSDVRKASGRNMSLSTKILIGVGIGLAVGLIVVRIIFHDS